MPMTSRETYVFQVLLFGNCLSRSKASVLPHFLIYFTASWGMSREYLEETNFLIKNSDPINFKASKPVRFTLFFGTCV